MSYTKPLLGGVVLACIFNVSPAESGGPDRAPDKDTSGKVVGERSPGSVPGRPPVETAVESRESVEDPEIRHITSGIANRGDERISISVNGFYPPRVFALEGDRPRIVCDFEGARLAPAVPKSMVPDGPLVKMIRIGVHRKGKGKVRVVLDLKTGNRYEVEQVFFRKENIFELTVKSLGKESK